MAGFKIGNGNKCFIKSHLFGNSKEDIDKLIADAFAAETFFYAKKCKIRQFAVHTHHIIYHKANGFAFFGFCNNYISVPLK